MYFFFVCFVLFCFVLFFLIIIWNDTLLLMMMMMINNNNNKKPIMVLYDDDDFVYMSKFIKEYIKKTHVIYIDRCVCVCFLLLDKIFSFNRNIWSSSRLNDSCIRI